MPKHRYIVVAPILVEQDHCEKLRSGVWFLIGSLREKYVTKFSKMGLSALIMFIGCNLAWAGPQEDFKKGSVLFNKGNTLEALKFYNSAAQQGHAGAVRRQGFWNQCLLKLS